MIMSTSSSGSCGGVPGMLGRSEHDGWWRREREMRELMERSPVRFIISDQIKSNKEAGGSGGPAVHISKVVPVFIQSVTHDKYCICVFQHIFVCTVSVVANYGCDTCLNELPGRRSHLPSTSSTIPLSTNLPSI